MMWTCMMCDVTVKCVIDICNKNTPSIFATQFNLRKHCRNVVPNIRNRGQLQCKTKQCLIRKPQRGQPKTWNRFSRRRQTKLSTKWCRQSWRQLSEPLAKNGNWRLLQQSTKTQVSAKLNGKMIQQNFTNFTDLSRSCHRKPVEHQHCCRYSTARKSESKLFYYNW